MKKLKEYLIEMFRSPGDKDLDDAEKELRITASEANALMKNFGITSLSSNQKLFMPNRYYHEEIGIFEASFEEIINLCKVLTPNQ